MTNDVFPSVEFHLNLSQSVSQWRSYRQMHRTQTINVVAIKLVMYFVRMSGWGNYEQRQRVQEKTT